MHRTRTATEHPAPLACQIPEVARRLSVGRSLVYCLIREGKLRLTKIGNRSLVTETELQRFLAEAEANSGKVAP